VSPTMIPVMACGGTSSGVRTSRDDFFCLGEVPMSEKDYRSTAPVAIPRMRDHYCNATYKSVHGPPDVARFGVAGQAVAITDCQTRPK